MSKTAKIYSLKRENTLILTSKLEISFLLTNLFLLQDVAISIRCFQVKMSYKRPLLNLYKGETKETTQSNIEITDMTLDTFNRKTLYLESYLNKKVYWNTFIAIKFFSMNN